MWANVQTDFLLPFVSFCLLEGHHRLSWVGLCETTQAYVHSLASDCLLWKLCNFALPNGRSVDVWFLKLTLSLFPSKYLSQLPPSDSWRQEGCMYFYVSMVICIPEYLRTHVKSSQGYFQNFLQCLIEKLERGKQRCPLVLQIPVKNLPTLTF